jgi:hypothetical protein
MEGDGIDFANLLHNLFYDYLLAVTTKSTRRLIARPSLVSLEAMGLDSP